MDYINPYGVSGTRPAYQNGNPSAGIQGSVPDVRCWEYPMREIVAVIEGAGLTASNGDLTQLLKAIQALATSNAPSVGSLWHIGSASGGVSSAYTTNLSPVVPSGSTNFFFSMPMSVSNTKDAITGFTTVDYGDGPRAIIRDADGVTPDVGQMPGGVGYVAFFFVTGGAARLMNPSPVVAGASTSKAPKLIGFLATGGAVNMGTSVNYQMPLTVAKNNLWGTSSFSSNQFTVGLGEAGIYSVTSTVWWQSALAGIYTSSIFVNGTNSNVFAAGALYTGGGGISSLASGDLALNVGDVVKLVAYQQTGSTQNSTLSTLSMYLKSAY